MRLLLCLAMTPMLATEIAAQSAAQIGSDCANRYPNNPSAVLTCINQRTSALADSIMSGDSYDDPYDSYDSYDDYDSYGSSNSYNDYGSNYSSGSSSSYGSGSSYSSSSSTYAPPRQSVNPYTPTGQPCISATQVQPAYVSDGVWYKYKLTNNCGSRMYVEFYWSGDSRGRGSHVQAYDSETVSCHSTWCTGQISYSWKTTNY